MEPQPAAILKLTPKAIAAMLAQSGYEPHRHLRLQRPGEVMALRRIFDHGRRQVHVQLCKVTGSKDVALYAHTERITEDLVGHAVDLLNKSYSYPAGARMLRQDLRRLNVL